MAGHKPGHFLLLSPVSFHVEITGTRLVIST
jgi:hypothetical protein